jgi:hypothetical protein
MWARNPTARSSVLQTRWMPCSVASATSASVVVGRFASSHALEVGPQVFHRVQARGRRPAAARHTASRVGCPGRHAFGGSSGPTAHPTQHHPLPGIERPELVQDPDEAVGVIAGLLQVKHSRAAVPSGR